MRTFNAALSIRFIFLVIYSHLLTSHNICNRQVSRKLLDATLQDITIEIFEVSKLEIHI